MIASIKALLGEKFKKLNPQNTEVLEGVCAACAIVAAADGDISDKEIEATMKAIASNKTLAGVFPSSVINATAERMLKRAEGGRIGQHGLLEEIREGSQKEGVGVLILLGALDVAEGDGSVSAPERAKLEQIAKACGGLKLEDYGV